MTRWTPRRWRVERRRGTGSVFRAIKALSLLVALLTVVFWTHAFYRFSGITDQNWEEADAIFTPATKTDSTIAATQLRVKLNTSPRKESLHEVILPSPALKPQLRETFKEQPMSSGDWVSTDTYLRTKLKLFLYSAYLDNRLAVPVVRVIGAYASVNGAQVSCRLEYASEEASVVAATKKTINENWKLKYGAAFFLCPYSDDSDNPPPVRVRLKETYELQWSPSIPIWPLETRPDEATGRFAVCVKPLHYKYDRVSWLAEFVEFHRIVGVDRFFFYNHSIGSNVDRLLRVYMEKGVVTSLPWNLDIKSQKEIRTEGLFAALNDCVYRSMNHFDYVLVLDLDEFAVPRKDDSLPAMVTRLKRAAPRTMSYVLLNSFFYLYWENDTTAYGALPETTPLEIPYLLTQFKTRRSRKVFRVGSRSKYIVRPVAAVEVGNHVVWRYLGGRHQATQRVSPEDALLHHYRICEFGGFDCVKQPSIVDRSALRFNTSLLERVNSVCAQAFPDVGRCPKAPGLGSPW